MLTIQPKVLNNYRPAFKANERMSFDISSLDEDSYEGYRDELKSRKEEFEDLVKNEDFSLPKPLNKALKGGAAITTGLLGGMATGWGTKKSFEGFARLFKSKPVQGFIKKTRVNAKLAVRKLKPHINNIIKSKGVKKVVNYITNAYNRFAETKFGKPISKTLSKIGNGFKFVFKKAFDGIKYVVNKIKGVNPETYKNATINNIPIIKSIKELKEIL